MRDRTFRLESMKDGVVRLYFGDGRVGSPIGWREFVSKAEYKAWSWKDLDGRYPSARR